MLLKFVCLVTVLSYASAIRVCETYADYANYKSGNCSESHDDKDMPELVSQYGYQIDTHKITTKDGYILTVFNLKHPKPIGVAIFNHFLFGSSACWVDKGNTSLGYALYNAGYDVWMINFRGNYYSQEHVSMKPTNIKFWDFTFHEMGIYDLPAFIAYVQQKTKVQKLHYIGYSMGGSVVAIYCSLFPQECENSLKEITLLAPGVSFEVTRAFVVKAVSYLFPLVYNVMKFFHMGQIFTRTKTTVDLLQVCRVYPGVRDCMTLFQQLTVGPSAPNPPMNPIIFYEFPAGQSMKTLNHFGQILNSKSFSQYDFGEVLNEKYYNSTKPPLYPVENIVTPIYVMSGTEDYLVPPENVLSFYARLQPKAKAAKDVHLILGYNHADYVWAADRAEKINIPVLEVVNRYN